MTRRILISMFLALFIGATVSAHDLFLKLAKQQRRTKWWRWTEMIFQVEP